MLFWFSIILFIVTLLGLYVMTGCWVYNDAKVRSEKPITWTLIALLVPNLFGLLVYLLVGRKDKSKITKNKFKKPLISFAVCTLASTILFIGNIATSDDIPIISGVSIGMINNNIGDKWNVTYKTSGEMLKRTIDLSCDGPKILYFKGSCKQGKQTLYIMKNSIVKAFDVTKQTKILSVNLSKFGSGKINLLLCNENARNASFKAWWR